MLVVLVVARTPLVLGADRSHRLFIANDRDTSRIDDIRPDNVFAE